MKAGDHVGILATNCIEWVESLFAIYKIRASAVNINFRYVEEELRYLFENSDVVACIYQREYGPLVAAARSAQPRLAHFIRIEWNDSTADDSRSRPDRVRGGRRRGLTGARLRRTLRRRHLPPVHRRHHRHAQGRDVAPGGRVLRARRRHRRVHQRTRCRARDGEREDRHRAAARARRDHPARRSCTARGSSRSTATCSRATPRSCRRGSTPKRYGRPSRGTASTSCR